jgi:hypothetical protein
MPSPTGSKPLTTQIASDSDGDVVLFNVEDYDRFVMTQRELFSVAANHQTAKERKDQVAAQFGAFTAKLRTWCRDQSIFACYIAPRLDDIIVAIVANDEDAGGSLHDRMAEFDYTTFSENNLRLYWMLLRKSELPGISSFVKPADARLVFRADA